jgi:sugar phosphate isomerase/epimerase
VQSLQAAATVVRNSGHANAGVVIDTLHMDRSREPLTALDAVPAQWFRFVQVCDAPGEYSNQKDELIRIGRGARLYLGEGGIDIAAMLRHLPNVPLSVEIPHIERQAELGAEEHARRSLETARRYLDATSATTQQRGSTV